MEAYRFVHKLPLTQGAQSASIPLGITGWQLANDWIAQHPVHAAWLDANDVLYGDTPASPERLALAHEVVRWYDLVQAAIRQWQPYAAADLSMRLAEAAHALRESKP